LTYFGRNLGKARKDYLDFVKDGIEQGRRPELVGGGLIRSLGGWAEVKTNRLNKVDRIKSDERILGDSEFVMQVLAEADETFSRRYKLKSQGYDIARIEQKVVDLFGIKKDELYSGSRKKPISEARSVFCYWCVRELGESMTSIAKRLGLTQPAIGYAVDRGEEIVKKRDFKLLE
jgi:chromosomal replication initiation ATPase DnaA